MAAETDDRGRLYLPEAVRERYGDRFHLVTYQDRIVLRPVADEPLEAVREAAGELREVSDEEIRSAIDAEAVDVAGPENTASSENGSSSDADDA